MAVAFGAFGTFSDVSTATTAVAYPTGITAGQLLVLVGMPKVGSLAMSAQPAISGWVSRGFVRHGTTASGNDAGSMAAMVWTRVADGTETGSVSVAWGITPAAGQAVMYRVTNATGWWDVAVATAIRTATTTSWSVTYASDPGLTMGDLVNAWNATPTDLNTASAAGTLSAPGVTAMGLANETLTHRTSATGSDSSTWMDRFSPTLGTSTGAATYTSTLTGGNNLYGVGLLIRIREIPPPAPQNIPVGQAIQSDTAFPLTGSKAASVGQVVGSGSAGVVSRAKAQAVGQSVGTNLANGVQATVFRFVAVGQAVEGDSALLPLLRSKRRTISQGLSGESSLPAGRRKGRAFGQVNEADSGTLMGRISRATLGLTTESATGQPVTRGKRRGIGQAATADAALPQTRQKALGVGTPQTTDSAFLLGRSSVRALEQASEVSEAQGVERLKVRLFFQAAEEENASSYEPREVTSVPLGVAVEIDQGYQVVKRGGVATSQATSSEIAWPFGVLKARLVGLASEYGSALPFIGKVPQIETPTLVYVADTGRTSVETQGNLTTATAFGAGTVEAAGPTTMEA